MQSTRKNSDISSETLSQPREDAVFLVLAGKAAKQGVLMLEIKRTLGELKSALM